MLIKEKNSAHRRLSLRPGISLQVKEISKR